jgi:hypothetical protein
VIKIFKERYVIVEHIGWLSGVKFFRCPYYVHDTTKINLSYRYTLIEILNRLEVIKDEELKVFRITRTGKLKRFI